MTNDFKDRLAAGRQTLNAVIELLTGDDTVRETRKGWA
jgi:hypothetical protein